MSPTAGQVDPAAADDLVQAFATLPPERLAKKMVDRLHVERANGMLMAIYGTDADHAFLVLKWRSQETNVKVRDLARQLVIEFPTLTAEQRLPTASGYDGVLLTAHLSIPRGTTNGRMSLWQQ